MSNEKVSFTELYLNGYHKAVSVGDMSLKDIEQKNFNEDVGQVLRSTDKDDRRILILVGDGHNIVLSDRFPRIPGTMFNLNAHADIRKTLPMYISNAHLPYLLDMAYCKYEGFQ